MSRFNIRSLMIVIAVVAVTLSVVPLLPVLGSMILGCSVLIGLCWYISRSWPAVSLWFMVSSVLLGFVPSVWLGIWHYEFGAPMLILVLSLFTTSLTLASGFSWVRSRKGRQRPSDWQAGVFLGFFCALLLSLAVIPWPLYLAFAISKPSLERLADHVAAGGSVTSPEWAGVYLIVGSRSDSSGNVALLTDANPNGPIGFVRTANLQARPLVFPTDLWVPLSRSWSYDSED